MHEPLPNDARYAGLLYSIPMLVGPFSMMVVPSAIVVANDAAKTTANVLAEERLFRAGLAGDAVIVLSEIALTAVLYTLLAPAGKTLALGATFARLTMTVLQAANMAPAIFALEIATSRDTTSGFDVHQREAIVLQVLELRALAVHVWEVPFAFHCALVAILVHRGGRFPRPFAVLMGVAAVGYATNGIGNLVYPGGAKVYESIVAVAALGGEVPFVLWLVFRGAPVAVEGSRRSTITVEAWESPES